MEYKIIKNKFSIKTNKFFFIIILIYCKENEKGINKDIKPRD